MYYDIEKISRISDESHKLYEIYKDSYILLKQDISAEIIEKSIWCRGWSEPFGADYISEINDGTIEERKILKKKPFNKKYTSEHCFVNGAIVFSTFWGENEDLVFEKYFINTGYKKIGVMFKMSTKQLYSISIETLDEKGHTVEYTYAIAESENIEIEHRNYIYEDDHIIKAYALGRLQRGNGIILYDNSIYKDVGTILDPTYPNMNPGWVCKFEFIYGDDGYPSSYTRTSYSYGKTYTHTWKMKKSLVKKYNEYGINVFYKKCNE